MNGRKPMTEDSAAILRAALHVIEARRGEKPAQDGSAGDWAAIAAYALGVLIRMEAGKEAGSKRGSGRGIQEQGQLTAPDPVWTWSLLFRSCGELVSGQEIAARLGMDLATFNGRREQAHFPEPRIRGKRGRGYSHMWVTRDVLDYVHHYLGRGIIPPIMNERIQKDAARRRARGGC